MAFHDNQNPYQATYNEYGGNNMAAFAQESERTAFIRRTYLHLAGAVALFVALEVFYFTLLPAETLNGVMRLMLGNRFSWLIVMGAFVGVSWLADSWARSSVSQGMQYAGLFLYVLAQSVIFIPLLYIAQSMDPGGQLIGSAGLLTAIVFGGLTAMVFITRADLSWMGKFLFWAGIVAVGAIVVMILMNTSAFSLVFTVAMIGLASGYILYDTSNVLHHYRTDQHVAAALALFASVALLFWYILKLFMALRRD